VATQLALVQGTRCTCTQDHHQLNQVKLLEDLELEDLLLELEVETVCRTWSITSQLIF